MHTNEYLSNAHKDRGVGASQNSFQRLNHESTRTATVAHSVWHSTSAVWNVWN